MLRLALGTIAVSRTLWLDAGKGNSLSNDPGWGSSGDGGHPTATIPPFNNDLKRLHPQ
jgi:hypothetical protein